MRPLKPGAADRPVPNPHARPNPAFGAGKVPGRRKVARRKPAPAWRRPALVAGLVLLGLCSFGGGGWWAWHSGALGALGASGRQMLGSTMADLGLTVQEINVQGRSATPAASLLEAVGARRGDPILLFDAEAARQRIEQIGWVKSATVQRMLPDTVLLRIVERQPFARWQIDGRTVLIDRDGKVLAQGEPEDYRELRRVVGPGAADKVGALFDMLMGEPALFERVRTAVRVRGRRWDLELDNGTLVQLPEEHLETAWRHLAMVEREQKILAKALTAIDLRLPDRMVVRLMPEAIPAKKLMSKDGGTGRRA